MYRDDQSAAFERARRAFEAAREAQVGAGELAPTEAQSAEELLRAAERWEREVAKHVRSGRTYGQVLDEWYTCKRQVTAKAAELEAAARRNGAPFVLAALVGARPTVKSDAGEQEIADAKRALETSVQRMRAALDGLETASAAPTTVAQPEVTSYPALGPSITERAVPHELLTTVWSLRIHYEVTTSASLAESHAIIEQLVTGKLLSRQGASAYARTHASSGMSPLVWLDVMPAAHGSRIHVRMRPHAFVMTLAYAWVTLLVLALLGSCARGNVGFPGILFPLLTFLGWRGFNAEARKLHTLLFGVFPAPHTNQ